MSVTVNNTVLFICESLTTKSIPDWDSVTEGHGHSEASVPSYVTFPRHNFNVWWGAAAVLVGLGPLGEKRESYSKIFSLLRDVRETLHPSVKRIQTKSTK